MYFKANYHRCAIIKKTLLFMTSNPARRMRSHRTNTEKIFLAMKITTILLLSACVSVSAGSRAQKVTLLQKNVKLEKVFREIRKQTGYVFFYDTRVLERAKAVDIHVENVPVEQALKETLRGQPLDFSIERETITIFQKADYSLYRRSVNIEYSDTEIIEYSETEIPTLLNIIKGTVKDAQGNPLAGVSVIVKGTNKGTSSGTDGSFSIDANGGDVLEFTMVGYQKKSVNIGKQIQVNVVLELEVSGLSDVVVVGYGTEKKVNLTGAVSTVNMKSLENRPLTNSSQALYGVKGLYVNQTGSRPGDDVATIRIRG
jgi:hypothetical protein